MNLPVISASEVSTNEPKEVVSFDKWWIENLIVNGDQDGKITGLVVLSKFGTKTDGSMLFSGEKHTIVVDDILAESAVNPTLAAALSGIIQYVGQKAQDNDIL